MLVHCRRTIEILRTEGLWALTKAFARRGAEAAGMLFVPGRIAHRRNDRIAINEMRAKVRAMRAGPRELTVTSTTFCNLKCVMCEHAIEGMVERRHMDEQLVERLAPLIGTTSTFQLHGLGEPLLSPAFWKLLDKISSLHGGRPWISINSNGLLLGDKAIARILDSKLSEINISFDAATAATYHRIRGGNFSNLLANVEALVRARCKVGRKDFKITLNMTLMRANIEELPDFVRLAKKLGADEVAFWRLNDGEQYERPEWIVERDHWTFSYRNESPKHYPKLSNAKIREALRISQEIGMPIQNDHFKARLFDDTDHSEDAVYEPVSVGAACPSASAPGGSLHVLEPTAAGCATACDSRHSAAAGAASRPVAHRDEAAAGAMRTKSPTIGECQAPWRWLLVSERGDCSPCCYAQHPVGNLHEQTADEIWNGTTMQEIRASIARGEVHRACQGASCKYVTGKV